MGKIKVSIIVPVYNVKSILSRCIDSICNQTLEEIEIILVNDNSTDGSGVVCDEYAKKDARIRVLHLDNNVGPARARNYGIDIAQGEYIGFVDSDDYIDSKMYEKLYAIGKSREANIAMCSYNMVSGNTSYSIKLPYNSFYEGNTKIKENLLQLYYMEDASGLYSLWNKIFERAFVRKNNLKINEKLRRAEDAWFNFEVLKVAKSFVFIPDNLYYYVQNPESIMHSFQENQYELWVENRKKLLTENESLNFKIDKNRFYERFLYKVAIYCKDLVKRGKKDQIKEIFTDSFYRQSTTYTQLLPVHIKIVHKIAKFYPNLSILILILWNRSGCFIAKKKLQRR